MRTVLILAALAFGSAAVQADTSAAMDAEEKAQFMAEIEQEIERARQEIDSAARELAKLHQQKYAMGSRSNRAMLGVLLDGSKDQPGAVEIIGVTPGGGAAVAGMRAGDRIIVIGGVSLEDEPHPRKTLSRVMGDITAGDDIDLVYMRGDERVETTIATEARSVHMLALLDERLADKALELEELNMDLDMDLQMELKDLGSEIRSALHHSSHALMAVSGDLAEYFDVDEGVVVREVTADSEVKPGDVLLSIGDTDITDVMQAGELLTALQDDVAAKVKRHGRDRTVTIKPGEFKNTGAKVVTKVIRVGDD